jgi:ectoine hydroxylase
LHYPSRAIHAMKAASHPRSPASMKKGTLTPQQIAAYHRDGFLIARRFFDREEIELLSRAAHEDRVLDQHSFSRDDGTGASVRLSLWNHPGDGIYGMFARCRKLVDAVEQLLDDEAYHYHSKMIMKDAKVGGAWAWHQDYGYWYQNGVLTPNLCSVSLAVDAATKENGCMQVLKGSHTMGRVDHILSGEQAGADLERVREAMKRYELVYCVMKPGDALFFHANLLHASARNDSEKPRWSMICCYNAKSNDPYKEAHHPRYTPLKKVPDAMIKKAGVKRLKDGESNVAFLEVKKDASATSLKRKLAAK